MTGSADRLARECGIFTRFLLGAPPSDYVAGKYALFHEHPPFASTAGRFDAILVRMAGWHPLATRIVDLYARLFHPTGLVRQKLVALLAILEYAPESAARVNASGGGRVRFWAGLAWAGLASAVLLPVALVVITPVRIACRLAEKGKPV